MSKGKPAPATAVDSPPGELERETIAFWVHTAVNFGFSRSLGEIFGLIFISPSPLNADEIALRLNLSRSGVGQGLKTLGEIGAIKPAHVPSSRKEHFQMQTDLGVLLNQVVQTRLLPRIEEFSRQQTTLQSQAQSQNHQLLAQRFDKLARWQSKAAPVLTLLRQVL